MTRVTLSLYIALHFLKNLVFVFALFLFLIVAVDMIELARDLPSVPDAGLRTFSRLRFCEPPLSLKTSCPLPLCSEPPHLLSC